MDVEEKLKNKTEETPIVDEGAAVTEIPPAPAEGGTDTAPVDIGEQAPVEPAPVDETSALIAKHFPNIEITEENKGDLLAAAKKIERHDRINRELAEIAESDPTFGRILIDLRKGADFQTALARHVDVENLAPMEGDPNYEEWNTNISKRKETMAEREKRKAEEQENIESSIQALKEFKESKGLKDEDAEGFLKYMMEILDSAFNGKLTPEFINRMYLAMNYDADTDSNYQKGVQEGSVKARNEKLSDLKEKEDKDGTGLPDMSGGGGKMKNNKPQSFGAKFLENVI